MRKIYIILMALPFLFASCQDWLDVNKDPNTPTDGYVNLLLPSAQGFLMSYHGGYMEYSLGNVTGTISHHVVLSGNSYSITPTNFSVEQTWESIYAGGQKDLSVIISKSKEKKLYQYEGVAMLMKAIEFTTFVDVWGKVPFSEATQDNTVSYPKFEDGAEIYPQLITMIDDAVAKLTYSGDDLNTTPSLAEGDMIYKGDVNKWIQLANTWKLRMINNLKRTPMFTEKGYDVVLAKLVQENNFIDANSPFEFEYGTSKVPENRNPMYVEEYGDDTRTTYYISHWFYESMKGTDGFIPFLKDILDPRVLYYFYRQGQENPIPDYSNADLDFFTNRFASTSQNLTSGFKNYTCLGVYVCGGKYDDGTQKPGNYGINGRGGSGRVPTRLVTEHDVYFILAELADGGFISGDAKTYLEQGMEKAFDYCDKTAAYDPNAPMLLDSDKADYIAKILTQYDNAVASFVNKPNVNPSSTCKLEVIMTQKWIADFGNSVASYNDIRRTGFPRLFDPNTSDNDPETSTSFKFPYVLTYPSSSMINNKTIKDSGLDTRDITAEENKVFWNK